MTLNIGTMNPDMYSLGTYADLMDTPIKFNNAAGLVSNPMTPGLGRFGSLLSPKYQMKWLKDWDNFGLDRQVMSVTNRNNARFKMASQTCPISRQIQILHNEILENNQANVKEEYDKLVDIVRQTYASELDNKDMTDEAKENAVQRYADSLYSEQIGSYIEDDIKKNSSNSFITGLKSAIFLGQTDNNSADENISYITGAKVTKASKSMKALGTVLGGAGIGVAFQQVGSRLLNLKLGGGFIGGMLGAIAAGILAL